MVNNKYIDEILPTSTAIDTAKVEFYSYLTGQVKPLRHSNITELNTLINTCQGSTVLLKAPKLGKKAQYKWNGPSGFTSYSSEIQIDEINSSYQGFYHVTVSDQGKSIMGIIRLVVNESPKLSLAQKKFSSQQNLLLAANDLGINTNYTWLTAEGMIISSDREIYLSPHPAGKYKYKLAIEKDGCGVEDTFEIVVND